MAGERWQFTHEDLENTPSRKAGIDIDKELNYRQQAANFLQDMGQRLQVPQLVINTAIVYMHRFYMFHSFSKFHRNSMSAACLFLAAKVEEQPRKLEHVLKVAHMCLHRDQKPLDTKSETYLEQAQELVINENILLQTLGFDITVDHPHSHVVKTCTLVRATKDLAQTSYFLATNSLHLTNLCLQVNAKIVACVCINLACKWANWEIPRSSQGKDWYQYVDTAISAELLEDLTAQFVQILDKCPSKLKKKLMSHRSDDIIMDPPERRPRMDTASAAAGSERSGSSTQQGSSSSVSHTFTNHERKEKGSHESSGKWSSQSSSSQGSRPKPSQAIGSSVSEGNPGLRRVKTESTALSTKEYLERKERERLERDRLIFQVDKEKTVSSSTKESRKQSSSRVSEKDKHHSRTADQSKSIANERHHLDIMSQLTSDDKSVDKVSEEIERTMKELPPMPSLPLSDAQQPHTSSMSSDHNAKTRQDGGKRSHDTSRRSHDGKTRHAVEAKHHSKHRDEKLSSPFPPTAETSHKRERKNSSRSSKSPHKKELRSPLKPEVTASPHSEMKLKIKLPVDPTVAALKKEEKGIKLKIKSPTPPGGESRSGSDSEKKELKLKLNLKEGRASTVSSESTGQSGEDHAPMKLVLSKDKVSGLFSSGHHHKHRHSSSHHNSGDKRKRSHSPGSAEAHSRHSHKVSRASSSSSLQSGNGHHHGNSIANSAKTAHNLDMLTRNLDLVIRSKQAALNQQMNHNPPLPREQPFVPPPPPSEPPPQPPPPPSH